MAAEHDHSATIRSVELERLIFFSDAVFAIAITIMVLELRAPTRLPGTPAESARALAQGLEALIPRFMSYAMSFWIIGLYWFVHHRLFRSIRGWDDGLVWLNLLFLFWIAFLPFPVAVVGSWGDQRAAVVLYSAVLVMLGVSQILLWRHAARDRRLIDPGLDARHIRLITLRSAVPPIVAAIILVGCMVLPRPYFALFGFGLVFPIQRIVERIAKR